MNGLLFDGCFDGDIEFVELSSKIAVYIPTTINIDKACDTSKYKEDFEQMMANCFGGFSTTTHDGGYATDGKIVYETSYCIESSCTTEQLEAHISDIIVQTKKMRIELQQDAVMIEINGRAYMIK